MPPNVEKLEEVGEAAGELAEAAGGKSSLKNWINIISTTMAFVMAIAGMLKPNKEQAIYEETSKHLAEQSKAIIQLHEDLVAQRNFMDGYIKAQSAQVPMVPVTIQASPVTKSHIAPVYTHPIPTTMASAAPAPAPPAPAAKPPEYKAQDFNALKSNILP
jgi:hypothetical protein